jgi:hypothetical protein
MNSVIKLASFAFTLCWLSAPADAVELKGVVKSETGAPLADVYILTHAPTIDGNGNEFPGAYMELGTKTDENGVFKLPDHGRIVYFKRQDLNPITKILVLSATQVEIVMQDASSTTWKIPSCSSVPDGSKRIGIAFKVALPDNAPFRKRDGIDGDEYIFGFDIGGEKFEMMSNWGGSTSIEPDDDFLLNSLASQAKSSAQSLS